MAIRPLQLSTGWPTGWSFDQRILSRSIRSSVDHDGLYDLPDRHDLHHRFCSFFACFGLGRGSLWCCLGCFPGEFSHNLLLLLKRANVVRHSPRPMPARWYPPSSDPTLQLGCVCAGDLASSCRLESSERLLISRAISLGGFLSISSGCGLSHCFSSHTLPQSRLGTPFVVARSTKLAIA